ncbi:MAG: hypothetical protein Q4G10_00455 [Bacteroidia bacterium]|nr:hypothetical protein [Bacteroidia bacterium]
MKKAIVSATVFLMAAASPALSQIMETEMAILELTGTASLEELSEDVMDSFHSFASHSLNVNFASEKRLVSSGLFTRYQAASLRDYIKRNGPIMSVMELMLVDGFDEKRAQALAPFVSFEAGTDRNDAGRVTVETSTRCSYKVQDDEKFMSGASKLRIERQDRWTASFAAKSGYGEKLWPPETLSWSMACYSRNGRLGLYAGDFAGRFGQGLLMWSGFSLTGAQSAASFAKHPTGLSPVWTFSPGNVNRGAAADLSVGRAVLSAFWSSGTASGANFSYLARYGQFGLTWIDSGHASMDWRWSVGRLDPFGEIACNYKGGKFAGLAGCTFNFDYKVALSVLARYYDPNYVCGTAGAFRSSTKTSDEKGIAMAFDSNCFSLTADAAFHPSKGSSQHKTVMKLSFQPSDATNCLLRGVLRYRPQDDNEWREELRAELKVQATTCITMTGGFESCKCKAVSWLAYADAGYSDLRESGSWRIFLHMTAFKVDNWDDRIYLYERDIPGAFSVPAYYGRGCSISCTATYKWKRNRSFDFKVSNLGYPGMIEKKPGKTELKCQLIWNL